MAVCRLFAVLKFCICSHSFCLSFRQQCSMIFKSGLWADHSIVGMLSCSIYSWSYERGHCHLEICRNNCQLYLYIFLRIFFPSTTRSVPPVNCKVKSYLIKVGLQCNNIIWTLLTCSVSITKGVWYYTVALWTLFTKRLKMMRDKRVITLHDSLQ